VFTEGMWGEVEVQNCTQLDAAAMKGLLKSCITPRCAPSLTIATQNTHVRGWR
jgi:hypothetical protein